MSWFSEHYVTQNYSNFVSQAQALVGDLQHYERECREFSNQISTLKEECASLQDRNLKLQASEAAARDQFATVTQKFHEVTALAQTLSKRNAELESNNQKLQEQISADKQKWSTLKDLVLETDNDELVEKEKDKPTKKRTEREKEGDVSANKDATAAENTHPQSIPSAEKRSRPLSREDFKQELQKKLKELETKPNNAKLSAEIGHLYHKLKNPQKALDFLRKAFEGGLNDWITQYYIGLSYCNLEKIQQAEYFLTESIKLHDKSACTFTSRCHLYICKKDKQAAEADLTQAEKLGEKPAVLYELRMRLERLG